MRYKLNKLEKQNLTSPTGRGKLLCFILSLIIILAAESSAFAVEPDPDHLPKYTQKPPQKNMAQADAEVQEIQHLHKSYNGLKEQNRRTLWYGMGIGITWIVLCELYKLYIESCQ